MGPKAQYNTPETATPADTPNEFASTAPKAICDALICVDAK
jgi:hypothetical protein